MFEQYWDSLKTTLWNAVWASNLATLPPARAHGLRAVRIFVMLVRELADGKLNLRAASLVYTTLLSLIPVLAVSFWVLKAFDIHYQVLPTIMSFLQPLGEKGFEIGGQIIVFVEKLDVRALGSMGLAVLLFTVISLLYKIEQAFNYTWRVRRARSWAGRLSGYLTVVMIGPLLVFIAIGIVASITRNELVQQAVEVANVGGIGTYAGKLTPFALVVAAFTFVYVYMPNTKVRIRSALVGALVAGVLWSSAGWLFASLVVGSTRYTAIYSSFAILILFMMWLYIGWLILLAGASVSFYHQHPDYLGLLDSELRLSARMRERLALNIAVMVAEAHHLGEAPWTAPRLARRLEVPVQPMELLLAALEARGLVIGTDDEPRGYVPGRDIATIRIEEILAAARTADDGPHLSSERVVSEPRVGRLVDRFESAMDDAVSGVTLASIVSESPPPGPGDAEDAGEGGGRAAPVPIRPPRREGAV